MSIQHPPAPRKRRRAARPADRPLDKPKQADELIALTIAAQFFHDAASRNAYASFTTGEGDQRRRETWSVQSKRFRLWLCKRYLDEHGTVPAANAVRDAIHALHGQAVLAGRPLPVAVRLAVTTETDDDGTNPRPCVWLDLADEAWQVACIGPRGWTVLGPCSCPVRFVRHPGMLPLPEPVRGGRLDELRPFLNLPNPLDWQLACGWLLGAINPGIPRPILQLHGEQGSAKTFTARVLRHTFDPHHVPLRRLPRTDRDLMIAATKSQVLAYDNLSALTAEQSDMLCSITTGAGAGTRTLYENDAETLFTARRPILLTGIPDVATRADLADRCITVKLPPIPDQRRRPEADLWRDFEAVRPRVLGALLTAASAALANLPSTPLAHIPRMADFAAWVAAAEPALGWPAGSFLGAYTGNRLDGLTAALDDSPVGSAVLALMTRQDFWEGTNDQLLRQLTEAADDVTRRQAAWPRSARKLSADLDRLAPSLRAAGVALTRGRKAGGKRDRLLRLARTCDTPSPPSPPSPAAAPTPSDAGRRATLADANRPGDRPAPGDGFSATRDDRDDRDGPEHDWPEQS
jgi:hypothetical protein